MELIHAIVYGIVQGVTAYLPISSDAHIRLVQALAGWNSDESPTFVAFTAVIQLAPTLAVIFYFRNEIATALRAWFASVKGQDKDSPDAKLAWGVFWGTIPIVILGVLLRKQIEKDFRSLYYIAISLIVIAVFMFIAERLEKKHRTVSGVQIMDGIIVGFWQCLALIPGTSRSGSTITGSLFQGFTREAAARFAFLLAVPSFLAAGVYEGIVYRKQLVPLAEPLAVAFVLALVVAYGFIAWFMGFLQKRGVGPFVVYRLVLGVLILGLVGAKVVDPYADTKQVAVRPAVPMAAASARL